MLTGSKLELNWTAWNQSSFGRSECDEKSGKEEEKYQHDDDDDDGKLDFQEEKWTERLVPATVPITPKGKLIFWLLAWWRKSFDVVGVRKIKKNIANIYDTTFGLFSATLEDFVAYFYTRWYNATP